MSKRKTTWREKLADDKGLPVVQQLEGRLAERWGPGTMIIPAPVEVDEIMRRVPEGRLTTIQEIRNELARKHRAQYTCPMTTGIFAWISAHAAEEAREAGENSITPYWRTLKTGGELNPKYPGGIEAIRRKLESEGHTVEVRGSRAFVSNFEASLVSL